LVIAKFPHGNFVIKYIDRFFLFARGFHRKDIQEKALFYKPVGFAKSRSSCVDVLPIHYRGLLSEGYLEHCQAPS
jgi:hypothetical protein